MPGIRKLPSPITILMAVIVLAAAATWIIPPGQYDTLEYLEGDVFVLHTASGDKQIPFKQASLDSLGVRISPEKFSSGSIRKPVSVPGTFHRLERTGQGIIAILQAPIKGIYDSMDIILFILVIGGFITVFNESGAMNRGLKSLSWRMKGRESWLIIILTFLFSFGGASYGMSEESLVFYPVLVPLFLAAGFDLIVPVAVIFGGNQLGYLASFTNPFSTIIASNAAGVNWAEGLYARIAIFFIAGLLLIGYIIRYARKIRKDPTASFVYRIDGEVKPPYEVLQGGDKDPGALGWKDRSLLLVFLGTFLMMIAGVVGMDWWLTEMTTLFLGSSLLVAFLQRMKEGKFIALFIQGASGLLVVAFIVGVARGVTVVLNEGHISDSILYFSANLVNGMPPALFIVILLLLFMVFTLFISSSSGMAVLTMPIMGALAIMVNVPGKEIVNAYLFGMGIMGFVSPTNMILPSLALVNVSYKAWIRFITPLLVLLFVVCALFLVFGLYV